MEILYTKQAEKQISKLDKTTKNVPNDELVLKFIPSDVPEQDELSAIAETKDEINLISHNNIDWDS